MKLFTFSFSRFICHYRFESHLNMSSFVSSINHISGKSSWVMQDENYDYHQEIARSAYADMLHDTERNKKYFLALGKAIQLKRDKGEKVHVLDIGTGTGLLSMMAASLGADTVTACEAFKPMADCARKIIQQNGYGNKIKLIPKRSTGVSVGPDGDMSQRANILVTEVFDTELIGEGAYGTYTHAHKELLEENCIVVPSSSNMYVQVVSSEFISRWKDIQPIKIQGCDDVRPPSDTTSCSGAIALHDLQLQELPRDKFTCLSEPLKVFRFDFSGKIPLVSDRQSEIFFEALSNGQVNGFLMWWDLQMDTNGEIDLSCAPDWGHPNPKELQWRDHWMQAVYYPSNILPVQKGDKVKVISYHSEYNLWFDVAKENCNGNTKISSGLNCLCGIHTAISRTRFGMINDPDRKQIIIDVLRKNIKDDTVCLCISDGSLLPLIAARLGAKQVYTIESNPLCKRIVDRFLEENNLSGKIKVIEKHPENVTIDDLDGNKVDLVVGEPYFQTSMLPWHHIQFWHSVKCLPTILHPETIVLPCRMTIHAVAVDFIDLWKIKAPIGNCEGFDLDIFDKLIEASSDIADEIVEPHPLWEYPCQARSDIQKVYTFDYTDFITKKSLPCITNTELNIKSHGNCNGVVLWADFDFGDGNVITTGPRDITVINQKIEWDYYSRQGVHLLKKPVQISAEDLKLSKQCVIKIETKFEPFKSDDFAFAFSTKYCQ
ncbi:protein arginine N-methyltransferase 7-like [Mytilus edulis]|uniref:protein arginine N-methyltransferase 7-like n=1 Tax=Mytilus edulis TaxID=6550 RepID=UPI0039EE0708